MNTFVYRVGLQNCKNDVIDFCWFVIFILFDDFNLYLKPGLSVIHIVEHSSNTATQLQQLMALLHQHKVTDISASKQAATSSVSLRVIYKPKILQSSCQYLLLLLDSSPWAKVIRCGYQEDWQRNQQWVVNMLCATWRHCFDVAAVLSSCSIFICLLRGIHGSCEKYEYITPFTVAVEEIFFIRQRSKTFGQFFLC